MSNAPTPRQQEIIREPGNLLVVAGPGSGKTATVVLKIAHILSTPANTVVAVTFTRDGANELRSRLAKVLTPRQLARVRVATFHSLTIEHLRRHGRLHRIATPAQQKTFLARARQMFAPDLKIEDQQLAFEAVKCSLALTPALQAVADSPWYQAYEETLRRHQLMDLQDVMRLGVQLMTAGEIPPLDCTHLIVDEAQDNDELQAAWVAAHRRQIVTMVGDDDQTVYEWRRAVGFHGMVRFKDSRNARVILLEDNWRSRSEIITAASAVIARNNPHRNDKALVPRRGAGGSVTKVATGSTAASCEAVESLLEPYLIELPDSPGSGGQGVKTGSWAVLARTNLLLDFVEAYLSQRNIRTFRSSGSMCDHPIAQTALQTLSGLLTHDTVGLEMAMHHAKLPHEEVCAVIDTNRANVAALLDGRGDLSRFKDKRTSEFFVRTSRWRKLISEGSFSSAVDRVFDFVATNLPSNRQSTAEVLLPSLAARLGRMCGDPAQRVAMLLNDSNKRSAESAVLLYTLHGAKGLEFDNVAIVGADDKEMPGEKAVDLPPGAVGIEAGQSTVAAERRLFYVGMTRAKENLWVLHGLAGPSRFVLEMPGWVPTMRVSEAGARPEN